MSLENKRSLNETYFFGNSNLYKRDIDQVKCEVKTLELENLSKNVVFTGELVGKRLNFEVEIPQDLAGKFCVSLSAFGQTDTIQHYPKLFYLGKGTSVSYFELSENGHYSLNLMQETDVVKSIIFSFNTQRIKLDINDRLVTITLDDFRSIGGDTIVVYKEPKYDLVLKKSKIIRQKRLLENVRMTSTNFKNIDFIMDPGMYLVCYYRTLNVTTVSPPIAYSFFNFPK
ncbi:hypothetical protein EIN_055210 [Entamoeba invadens IP1]|uniref:hypothetical protein n=1 Tax=Entamoeba invadens IP1 TaxID=370355 RepID=UPI0002C3D762|nr:hypothetical protein EIN_055210 [Entamoeba invadens IP1]ELP93216.1 hypothetical protein EIN_055210 [Entamoeba invadens IP1]|eukprot:XP_004259987.1 hypothetical protein EIN_055210 [Entamoeba invadens IP1]